MNLGKSSPAFLRVEIVTYNPEDPDTFPSVCHSPDEVKWRFGFTGGERLIFTVKGRYVGQLVKSIPAEE